MCKLTSNGFGKPSDLTLCIKTEEIVKFVCGLITYYGSDTAAEVVSESCG